MGLSKRLSKRLTALEARKIPGDRWPPIACDWKRRLAKYAAYFEGRPWECIGTPERRAKKDANLDRYKKYFDQIDADVTAPEWPMKLDGMTRRLAALENGMEEEGLVPISFQWMEEDGISTGPLIERLVPESRFGWLNETQS